jgi:hypothetical protein
MPTTSTVRTVLRTLSRAPFTPFVNLSAMRLFGLGRLRRRRHAIAERMSRRRLAVSPVLRFALHFGEMTLVMFAGMMALGMLNDSALHPVGLSLTGRSPEGNVLAMGLFMAAPMLPWMRLRGHGWRHGAEMAAAMFVPFAGAVALHTISLLPRADMMSFGNDLMWLAMLGIMLVRRCHYAGSPHAHTTPSASLAKAA